jgi:MFS superfamily sulfate permease-like transporter
MQQSHPQGLGETLRSDLPASVVVFFIAVPLCLGIALASGAPLFSGLIAGIVGGLVVGVISRSPLGVSGPAAGLTVIVLQAIATLGFEVFLLAVVLSGVLQVALGYARAGVLGYFFPSSVIRGMLSAIGIIIVLKQIPLAVGYDADPMGELQYLQQDGETTLTELGGLMSFITPNAVLVAAVSLAILIVWDKVLSKRGRFFKLIQGPLVAVAFGIVWQLFTARFLPAYAFSPEHLVAVPIANGLAELRGLLVFPDWSAITNPAVWLSGLTIAVVGSLETLLCVDATDKLDPQKRVTPANRELLAQGAGNILSGAIGGLPVTQVIVRSSANIQSGARSKWSAILHGLWLLVAVVALPRVLNLVPLSVLAAILLVVGYKLAAPGVFRKMFDKGWDQFAPFVVTIAGIVFTDLLVGILMGLVTAVLILLHRSYKNSHFLHMEEQNGNVRLTLAEEVTFLNKGAILRELSRIPDGRTVTIDQTKCHFVDQDVVEIIDDFKSSAAERDIVVHVLTGHGPQERARRAG